jgi:cell division protein FtsQ
MLMGWGIVVALAALAWAVLWSPLLAVRAIKVVGGRHTPVSEVARVTGLDERDNLLLVSTDAVAQNALSLPWVRDVEVSRMLPGTIRLRIKERRPALILLLGTKRWTLDADGRVLAAGESRQGLPVLAGVQVDAVSPGVRLLTSEARGALRAYGGLPRDIKRKVVGIFAPTLERITFSLEDHTLVRYGAAEHLAAKNAVLRVLRARLSSQGETAAYIDVRVPSSPAISATPPAAAGAFDD